MQVNLEQRLNELNLAEFFPEEVGLFVCLSVAVRGMRRAQAGWPQINAVHELATRRKKAQKDAGDSTWEPWVAFEIKRFLPDCFPEHLLVHFEAEEEKQPKASSRRLELSAWLAAWDGCVLLTPFSYRTASAVFSWWQVLAGGGSRGNDDLRGSADTQEVGPRSKSIFAPCSRVVCVCVCVCYFQFVGRLLAWVCKRRGVTFLASFMMSLSGQLRR